MSFGGRLARGLALGLSGYLGEQARQQAEDRRSQILLEREKALAQFQSGLRREELAATAEENRKTYRDKVTTDVAGEAALLGPKTDATIKVNEAKEAADLRSRLTELGVKFRYDTSLAELREKWETIRTNIREDGQDRRQEDQQQHDLDTKPVLTAENGAGEPTAVFAPGARTRTITARGGRTTGTLTRKEAPPTGFGFGTMDGDAPAPNSAPASPSAPSADVDPRFQQLLNESFTHPATKDLNAAERKAKLRELAGTLGIPVPQGY